MLHRSAAKTVAPHPRPKSNWNTSPLPSELNPTTSAVAGGHVHRESVVLKRIWERRGRQTGYEEEMPPGKKELGEEGEKPEDSTDQYESEEPEVVEQDEGIEGGEEGGEGITEGGERFGRVWEEAYGEQEGESSKSRREKRKQREYEVFIGGLDRETRESDLVKVFRRVGEVLDVRLVKRSFEQNFFAFVRFAEVEQAKRAASELRFVEVRGNLCGVTRSNSNETLHIANICTSWTKDDLVKKLKEFELENLVEVNLIGEHNGKNRGYAFLDFETHMDAVAACCKLQKKDIFFGRDIRADIAFSRSIQPDEEVMLQVKSVFLDGLPVTWDASQVQRHFRRFGEIENVQLACNMPSAKRKDFCFISFKTRKAALDCIDAVNNDEIFYGTDKISLKATLKRPERRLPLHMSIRRGYTGKTPDNRGFRSYGAERPYYRRPIRTHDSAPREYNDKIRDPNKLPSRHPYYRTILSPTIDAYGDQSRKKYVMKVPEDFEFRPTREYARQVPERYGIQSNMEYVREEALRRYEGQPRREIIREIPEYESHSRRYVREFPESYGSHSERVIYVEAPEKYERYPGKQYVVEVPEKFDSRPRRAFVMEAPALACSRSRERYLESCSSSRHAFGSYKDSVGMYSNSQGLYSDDDDIFDSRCDLYESREVDTFHHPTFAGIKRRYSDADDDLLESSSLMRNSRSRMIYEVDASPLPEYADRSRILSDEPFVEYPHRNHGCRYMSRSGASRS